MGSKECALTVNASDFHIPWRMLYTHPDLAHKLADDGSNFQPIGFWGYRHIIEQLYPFAEDRLPESLHFAESDVIVGVVRGEKCPQSRLWA